MILEHLCHIKLYCTSLHSQLLCPGSCHTARRQWKPWIICRKSKLTQRPRRRRDASINRGMCSLCWRTTGETKPAENCCLKRSPSFWPIRANGSLWSPCWHQPEKRRGTRQTVSTTASQRRSCWGRSTASLITSSETSEADRLSGSNVKAGSTKPFGCEMISFVWSSTDTCSTNCWLL